MIVSASYRTDIPAFFGDWFQNRLLAGWAEVKNPYSGRPYRVELDPTHAEGFVFWTRNCRPFFQVLEELSQTARPFVVQFTCTGYPRILERSVVDWQNAVGQIRQLSDQFGRRTVVWRYDPILLTEATDSVFHRRNFDRLAQSLCGYVDEVVLSFAQIYRKTARNMNRHGSTKSFSWSDPPDEEKSALLEDLADLALARGVRPTLCAQPTLLPANMLPARCIDAERLSDVAGHPVIVPDKGNRPGCACSSSRDIGAYNTCPHGCRFCYAVDDHERVRQSYRSHDPAASILA